MSDTDRPSPLQYDLKPLAPIVAILLLYFAFMPASGSPSLWSLARHQQVIALSSTPTMIVSLVWFAKANEPTPEERLLNDE